MDIFGTNAWMRQIMEQEVVFLATGARDQSSEARACRKLPPKHLRETKPAKLKEALKKIRSKAKPTK